MLGRAMESKLEENGNKYQEEMLSGFPPCVPGSHPSVYHITFEARILIWVIKVCSSLHWWREVGCSNPWNGTRRQALAHTESAILRILAYYLHSYC